MPSATSRGRVPGDTCLVSPLGSLRVTTGSEPPESAGNHAPTTGVAHGSDTCERAKVHRTECPGKGNAGRPVGLSRSARVRYTPGLAMPADPAGPPVCSRWRPLTYGPSYPACAGSGGDDRARTGHAAAGQAEGRRDRERPGGPGGRSRARPQAGRPGQPRQGPQGGHQLPGRGRAGRSLPGAAQGDGRPEGSGRPVGGVQEGPGRGKTGVRQGAGQDGHHGGRAEDRDPQPAPVGEVRDPAGDGGEAAEAVRREPRDLRRVRGPGPAHPGRCRAGGRKGQSRGPQEGAGRQGRAGHGDRVGRRENPGGCRQPDPPEAHQPGGGRRLRGRGPRALDLRVQAGRRRPGRVPAHGHDGRAVRQSRVRPQAVPGERAGRNAVRLPPDPGDVPEGRGAGQVRAGEGCGRGSVRGAAARGHRGQDEGRPEHADRDREVTMWTIGLLLISNAFMTVAWYGHLRFRGFPLWSVILVSWLIALPEYVFQVPANRLGYGQFSATQLKIIQEVISVSTFVVFGYFYLNETLTWRTATAFLFILAAVALAASDRESRPRLDDGSETIPSRARSGAE